MRKLFIVLALVLFAGCAASPTPNYDARFGHAVRQARQMMIINPNAGANPDPIAGMDGVAAKEAAARYHESFQKPPPVVNVINIGGGVGGGGGGR
jgi:hypothetical protein